MHHPSLFIDEHLAATSGAFAARFGRAPRFAAAAPGRVNLIGEHTDYNEGFVLPIAIARQTIIVADDAAANDHSRFWALDLKQEFEADLRNPLSPLPNHAGNYLLGVADQFQCAGHRLGNLDAVVSSTVPIGAGLASSAAVEVAFATLLEQVLNVRLDSLDKALLCQRAEHAFPRTPCGIMDMFIASSALAGHALLLDCRSNRAQAVRMPSPLEAQVLVIDTGVKHALAAGAYAERRGTCEDAAKNIGVKTLRDVTTAMLQTAELSLDQRKRALHVIAENARTILAAEALQSGDLPAFGELMFASHDSLRDLYEVSCAELDVLVEAARSLRGRGVIGARLTGGGFGGCVVALCQTGSIDQIQADLSATFGARFGRQPEMFTTTAVGGAQTLSPC